MLVYVPVRVYQVHLKICVLEPFLFCFDTEKKSLKKKQSVTYTGAYEQNKQVVFFQ